MAEKLSLTKLDKMIKQEKCDSAAAVKYEIGADVYEISVRKYIGFSEMFSLVDGVVAAVFQIGQDGAEHYLPQLLEYAKALHFIEYFTNIKAELGADRVFSLLYGTGIMKQVLNQINAEQRANMEAAIDAAIAHKLSVLSAGERARLSDAAEKLDQAARAIASLSDQFAGIGKDKIQAVFNKLAGMDTKNPADGTTDIRDTK